MKINFNNKKKNNNQHLPLVDITVPLKRIMVDMKNVHHEILIIMVIR